jgi:hypothetical protein
LPESVNKWLRTEFPFYGVMKSWLDKRISPQVGEVKDTTFTVTVTIAYLENCPLKDVEIFDSLPLGGVLIEGKQKWRGQVDQGVGQILTYKMKFNHGYGLLRLPPAIASINGFRMKSNAPMVLLAPLRERLVVPSIPTASKLVDEAVLATPQNQTVTPLQTWKKLDEEKIVKTESSLDKEMETMFEAKENLKTKIIAHAVMSAYEKIRKKKSEEGENV